MTINGIGNLRSNKPCPMLGKIEEKTAATIVAHSKYFLDRPSIR
jgi:hypothetical protein